MLLSYRPAETEGSGALCLLEGMACAQASLHWADSRGPLPDWTPFALVCPDADGAACFHLTGGRCPPGAATHIAACPIPAASGPTVLAPLPHAAQSAPQAPQAIFGIMSDLHLSNKPWRAVSAMRRLADTDCVLVAGDITNDGLPQQLEAFLRCVEQELPGVPVLPVTGNHDYPALPLPLVSHGLDSYFALQEQLLRRAEGLGVAVAREASGAYRATCCGVEVFALNAVTHFRRFAFPEGRQPEWLAQQLPLCTGRKLVLCHAPLQGFHPNHTQQGAPPYLARDAHLRRLIQGSGHVCFVSGHTHVSFSDPVGCVIFEPATCNLYLNDGSVTTNTLRHSEPLTHPGWCEGNVVRMSLFADCTELVSVGVNTGLRCGRGFYRIPW